MLYPLLEILVSILVLAFFLTQIAWPLWCDMPILPVFRRQVWAQERARIRARAKAEAEQIRKETQKPSIVPVQKEKRHILLFTRKGKDK